MMCGGPEKDPESVMEKPGPKPILLAHALNKSSRRNERDPRRATIGDELGIDSLLGS
jgi:hypothetical protein